MELLEGVVRQHDTLDLLRHLQDEGVTPADRAGWRRHDLTGEDGGLELVPLGVVDSVSEGRIDDDRERLVGELRRDRSDGFVELGKAREGSAFGRDVRSVHY